MLNDLAPQGELTTLVSGLRDEVAQQSVAGAGLALKR